jgi:hypothetical protein
MANNTISGTETEDNDYSAFDEVSSSPDDQSDLTVANTEAESAPLEAVTDKSPPFTPRVTLLPQTQPASPGSEAEAIEENGESATVEPDEEATRTTESPSETAPSGSEAVPDGIRGAQVEPGTEEPSQGIGEAEETRRPAEELSDSDRQQIVDRVRRGLTIAIDKFRPVCDALGVPIEEGDRNYHAAVVPTENGSVARFNGKQE